MSQAAAINSSGQVVGLAQSTDQVGFQIFKTDANGAGFITLPSIRIAMQEMGINDSGRIAGTRWVSGDTHAFITGPNGSSNVKDLGTLGGRWSHGTAINNSGQVVGTSETSIAPNASHAFITGINGTGMRDLGTLGGSVSEANAINNSGQVVGISKVGPFPNLDQGQAFLTQANGVGMFSLGTLGGHYSEANAINNLGEVVGVSTTADNEIHSFIYSHGGITDLSMLDVVLQAGYTRVEVMDINNFGQMVGTAAKADGTYEMFLLSYTADKIFNPSPILTPVPESETYAMLLAGLGIIGLMKRRQRKLRAAV